MWVRPSLVDIPIQCSPFQFTHPCGCDDFGSPGQGGIPGFNSRTRVGATSLRSSKFRPFAFQFTHPCGCDVLISGGLPPVDVSIHAPVWVRQLRTLLSSTRPAFQFTHPCGCDQGGKWLFALSTVSIHAPVWVRRESEIVSANSTRVSIHAPVWVRHQRGTTPPDNKSFNSRTRVGATGIRNRPARFRLFQFTHPCGCDLRGGQSCAVSDGFNSRTRVGATIRLWLISRLLYSFNSRTRVGATPVAYTTVTAAGVSIHAPVWVRPPPSGRST